MTRTRFYIGSTEIAVAGGKLELTGDYLADKSELDCKPDTTIQPGSLIEYRENDGTTVYWTGRIEDKAREGLSTIKIYGLGYEMNGIPAENVYTDQSPEAIVADVIDNNTTSLTYAGTAVSGITISKYIAKGYVIDIVKDMMDILYWRTRIDYNGNVYFEPHNATLTGESYTNGTNCIITDWKKETGDIINSVKVIGGFENYQTEETISETSTTFNLSQKPSGTMRITISGTEQAPNTYTVNAEDKTVVFTSSKTNPTFQYSYNRPVIVAYQDDESIIAYKQRYKELPAPWLNSTLDARQYAQKYIDAHSQPVNNIKLTLTRTDYTKQPNQIIKISDPTRTEASSEYIITKVVHNYTTNTTELECGSRSTIFQDWTREVEDRIKLIERRFQNDELLYIVRINKHKLHITLNPTHVWEQASPTNSMVAGHQTLGWSRTGHDQEPDCSGNDNHGTWVGTGVTTGLQYSTSGARLSCAEGNGSNRRCTGTNPVFNADYTKAAFVVKAKFNTFTGNQVIAHRMSGDANTAKIWYNSSTNSLLGQYTLDGTQRTLTIPNFSSTYSTGVWYTIILNLDCTIGGELYIGTTNLNTPTVTDSLTGTAYTRGTGLNPPQILYSTLDYANLQIDELMIFDTNLNIDARNRILTKDIYSSTDPLQANLKLWWAFDNPYAGDRSTARTTITE